MPAFVTETLAEPPPVPTLPEPPRWTEEQVQARIQDAVAQVTATWAARAQQQQERAEADLAAELRQFSAQRIAYFRQAEAEVVQLTLGIARKILQREASLDPALLRGLVRVALERAGMDTPATVRVSKDTLPAWQNGLRQEHIPQVEIVADPHLGPGECILACGASTATFNVETQLKEIEQSFYDLMAARPGSPLL